MKLRRGAAICGVAILLTSIWLTEVGASGYNNWFQVVQFNLYGFNGSVQHGSYNSSVAQDVVESLGARDSLPIVISLNEVCNGQFAAVRTWLNSNAPNRYLSFHSNSYSSGGGPSGTNCTQYGNALFVLSTSGSIVATQYANSIQAGGSEKRNYICADVQTPTSFVACTTHLAAGNPTIASQQLAALNNAVEPHRLAGRRMYLLGDYNLDRNQNAWCDWTSNALNGSYSRYGESDWPANRNTTDSFFGCKLDYTFMQNPLSPIFETDAYMFDAANSDHNWYQTYPHAPNGIGSPYGTLDGAVRTPGGVRVTGWTTDPEQVAPIDVHTYVGPYGYNLGAAGVSRLDVRAVYPQQGQFHGFTTTITNTLPAAVYPTCAFAINVGGGSHTSVGCINIDYQVDPIGAWGPVTVGWGFINVKGWTLDPDTTTAIPVHVYTSSSIGFGGTLGTPGSAGTNTGNASTYRSDVAAFFPAWGGHHGLDANALSPTGHKYACGYALNGAGLGGTHLLGCTQYLP